jgi:S-DNA-T family DNA segregation ATPase FtsK/SpoIIIE
MRPDPETAPFPLAPAPPRFKRTNPVAGHEQERQAAAVAAVVDATAPSETPAAIAQPEPSQVRYWRTPNRLVKQVWARRADAEKQPSVSSEVTAGHDTPPGEHLHPAEPDSAEIQLQDESDAPQDHPAAAPTPFANISDFAFWEGLSDPVPDEIDAALDVSEAIEVAPAPVAVKAPSVRVGNRVVGHVPMAAPVAQWSSAMATPVYNVSVKLSSQAWDGAGQGIRPAMASPGSDDNPIPANGVVVTRKAREAATQAPRRPASSSSDIAADRAPVLSQPVAFELPPITFLTEPPEVEAAIPTEILQQNAGLLEGVLDDFNVRGEIVQACPGPVVTLYELEPAPGTKSSRVISLADDIARSMSAISARVAVIPGKNAIGIELPNAKRETVFLRELLASQDFESSKHKLALGLGKTIGGEPVIVDLARMPHLLVAGTTGSGKSVAINTMILSLLYRLKPEQCRLIMVDPKMLELSVYDGIPHLLTPVVTDPKKAVVALKWAVREMEERYKKMSKLSVRNIDGFNARVVEAKAAGEVITRTVQTGFDKHSGEAVYEEEVMDLEPLPYIVVIVDEMADLMMVAGKEIEGTIQRLAQMARAAGIHVVLATQRPSVDVITGTIKANFPTRISFQVTSKIDSRTILGEMGAEQLLGQGDMLYMAGGGRITRVHGPFVSDAEVEKVVAHLKTQGRPQYLDAVTSEEEEAAEGEDGAVFDKTGMGSAESDDPYEQAVAVVLRDKKASTSYIQRRLQIGYNRAASIMERMENEGIVGPANHAGKREILVETGRAREDED